MMEKTIQILKYGTIYTIAGELIHAIDGSYFDEPQPAEFEPKQILQTIRHDFVDKEINVTSMFDDFDLWEKIQDEIDEEIKNL